MCQGCEALIRGLKKYVMEYTVKPVSARVFLQVPRSALCLGQLTVWCSLKVLDECVQATVRVVLSSESNFIAVFKALAQCRIGASQHS